MSELILFTDGSVHAQTKIGYGAYLVLPEANVAQADLQAKVRVRRFEQTSSTRIELQTLLWALAELQTAGCCVTVYTDSQNIVGLPARRTRLERTDYCSVQGKRLHHYELYRQFYREIDRLNCKIVKVRGHQRAEGKDEIAQIFTLVDRAARRALRADPSLGISGLAEL
jgi:ribonuclease HI